MYRSTYGQGFVHYPKAYYGQRYVKWAVRKGMNPRSSCVLSEIGNPPDLIAAQILKLTQT